MIGTIQSIEYVEHGLLQVSADVEYEVYIAIAGAHITRHLNNAGNLPKHRFLWLDDVGLDFLRRGISPRGVDVDLGILEVGQHLDG